jgi:hypothetical protein
VIGIHAPKIGHARLHHFVDREKAVMIFVLARELFGEITLEGRPVRGGQRDVRRRISDTEQSIPLRPTDSMVMIAIVRREHDLELMPHLGERYRVSDQGMSRRKDRENHRSGLSLKVSR